MRISDRPPTDLPASGSALLAPRWGHAIALVLTLVGVSALPACSTRTPEPVRVSREALGTVVAVTAYSEDRSVTERVVEDALETIAQAEKHLSAYPDEAADPKLSNPSRTREVTSVIEFNRSPFQWHTLSEGVTTILDHVEALGVEEYFSPAMLRVMDLYDFGGDGMVPDDAELARLVNASRAFEIRETPAGVEARFAGTDGLLAPPQSPSSSFAPPAVGLDLSGAAKGLALDAALLVLDSAATRGTIDGVLISAGSTTLVTGHKSGAEGTGPWRIGVEDPRDPEKVIGVIEYSLAAAMTASVRQGSPGTVSTSGDYQQSFVRDGVRYHHILDPTTGRPARGMRSLTVVGAPSALDSDILSTALFVMGVEAAESYAREHELGLFIVDAQGRTRIVPGPEGAAYTISAEGE